MRAPGIFLQPRNTGVYMRIGFAGLGAIGTPMAERLAQVHQLTVWNRTSSKSSAFAARLPAVRVATTPAALAEGAEAVVIVLDLVNHALARKVRTEATRRGLPVFFQKRGRQIRATDRRSRIWQAGSLGDTRLSLYDTVT